MSEVAARCYAVDGTPTDCVMLAIKHLLRDRRPDLVLSGVNAGGNVGEDLTYRGRSRPRWRRPCSTSRRSRSASITSMVSHTLANPWAFRTRGNPAVDPASLAPSTP